MKIYEEMKSRNVCYNVIKKFFKLKMPAVQIHEPVLISDFPY